MLDSSTWRPAAGGQERATIISFPCGGEANSLPLINPLPWQYVVYLCQSGIVQTSSHNSLVVPTWHSVTQVSP